jgi:hypothetical protein
MNNSDNRLKLNLKTSLDYQNNSLTYSH